MDIKPIHTEAEYEDALRLISAFFDKQPEPGTPDGNRFEALAMVIEAYEDEHYAITPPDPVEAIKFRMEQKLLGPA